MTSSPSQIRYKTKKAEIMSFFIFQPGTHLREDPYLTHNCKLEAGYSTLMRWIHDEGFRLKVPRSWPEGQDEEKIKAYIQQLRNWLKEHNIDIWFLDESGIEGYPCPKRRFAMKGEKIRQPYSGAHIRMNVTGMVLPRTGGFYALEFSHSDTQVFQTFLNMLTKIYH